MATNSPESAPQAGDATASDLIILDIGKRDADAVKSSAKAKANC